jgi:DNA repair ATPase RecN
MLLAKAKVGTVTALVNLLDNWSDRIKEIAKLENSQRSLQVWNDTYRVQRELIKQLLIKKRVSPEVIKQINAIYSTRSVNKAIEKSSDLFALEKSEVLKLVKSAIKYAKLSEDD